MSSVSDHPLWRQFRRLFLGTLVDALAQARLPARCDSLQVAFTDESVFKVPRFDNVMRFVGEASARLDSPPDADALRAFEAELAAAWPGLVGAVKIPIGDKLTVEKNEIRVAVDGRSDGSARLVVKFDLRAD